MFGSMCLYRVCLCISIYLLQGDIRNISELNTVIENACPDVVFHLASYGMSGQEMVSIYYIHEIYNFKMSITKCF